MRTIVLTFILLACLIGSMCVLNDQSTNAGLPLVHSSMPQTGFVCVPAITPRIRPARSKEIV